MTKQIETATVVANITVTGSGSCIVTSQYIPTSPVTVAWTCTTGESSSDVALNLSYALGVDPYVSAQYLVSSSTDTVILTDQVARANDTSLNIALADGTCTGITTAATSVSTLAGSGITNGYCTLDEFKAYLTVRGGTSSTDANDDTVIESIINATSRHIDNITGRVFYKNTVDETRYFTPEDPAIVFIDDLVSITSLKVDYYELRDYAKTLATTDYDLEPYNASNKGWPYTWLGLNPLTTEYYPTVRKGVQIVGVFGFPSVPDDIKEACLGIALNLYQSRTGQSSAGNVTVTGAGVVIRPTDVPAWAQVTLKKYQRLI